MTPHRGRPKASELAERGIDTRQNILDAFAKLVAEQGYDATTYAHVATAVGVAKGTVVHHFPSKDQMLQEGHTQYIKRRIEEMTRILVEVEQPELQLTAMIYCIVRAHRDDRAGTVAFLREFAHFASTELNPELQALRAEYTAHMTGIVRQGMASDTFYSEDPTLTALQVFGMVNYVWTWYRPDHFASAENIAAQFASTVLLGLMQRPENSECSPQRLLAFISSIQHLLAPVQTNAPSRLVSKARLSKA